MGSADWNYKSSISQQFQTTAVDTDYWSLQDLAIDAPLSVGSGVAIDSRRNTDIDRSYRLDQDIDNSRRSDYSGIGYYLPGQNASLAVLDGGAVQGGLELALKALDISSDQTTDVIATLAAAQQQALGVAANQSDTVSLARQMAPWVAVAVVALGIMRVMR